MRIKQILLILLITIVHETRPLIIGSNTLVSLESFVTFPEIDLLFDNIIRAFSWMKNGFSLQNSSTDLEFQSVYPVLGIVDLNGGTLTLNQDLIFKNVTTLNGLGTILAGGHAIEFCSSIKKLPVDTRIFDAADLVFNGNLAAQSVITLSGICSINGNGNRLDLTLGSLLVAANSQVSIRNVDLIGVKEGKLYCANDTASIILENVNIIQDATTTFSIGSLIFNDHVTFSGTGTFVLSSRFTSTVTENATLKFTDNVNLCLGRHPITQAEPLSFTGHNSLLYLDNISVQCTAQGIRLTNGTVIFNRDVTLDFLGTNTQTGVILGDGNAAHDIYAILNPGTTVDHSNGYWVYNNGQKNRIEANSNSARLIRENNSRIYVMKNLELQRSTVEIASETVYPIEVAPGATLSYLNSAVKLPGVELDIKANQLSSFIYQLDGSDSIFFTRGTLPLGVAVTGQNNVIKGNGGVSGPIILSDTAAQVSIGILGELSSYVNLNNGMMILTAPLILNADGIINGPGRVNIGKYSTVLSRTIESLGTSIAWVASLGEISLTGALSLLETWTLSGNITLNGNGNTLNLGQLGGLTVDADSQVTLKDIQITGVKNTNIKCLDNKGLITLYNAALILDNNYSFTVGKLSFERTNLFSGGYDFSYDTVYTSTIAADASLICDNGLRLQLGKSSVTSGEPLIFEDKTSKLILDQATLYVRPYGYKVTKGTIISRRNNTFDIQSTHTGNGLMFGNGIVDEDITIQLNPGSTLDLKNGHLVYNLANPIEGIVAQSQTAQLSRSTSFMTHFMRSADLRNFTFVLNPPALFTQDPGVQVNFVNILAATPIGQFNVTGRRVSITQIALEGNDKLEVKSGQFPSLLSVSGTGNTVSGEGAVNGTVTFADSSARLTSSLTGPYLQTIILNDAMITLGTLNRLGNGVTITGPGTINMGSQVLELGYSKTIWTTPLLWQGLAGTINLQSNVELQSTWTVSGNVVIKGNGFILELADSGEILLADYATLTLEDLKVARLSGTQIRCLGDHSRLVLDNVVLEQDGDYHFVAGALQVKGKVSILGVPSIFGYETNQTSTIHEESILKCDVSCTFSYDPGNAQNNLIAFEDTSSLLLLDQATLITTNTGLHFTKGMIQIRGDVMFKSYKQQIDDITINDSGIMLGDGVDEDNDTQLIVDGGSRLQIMDGSLRYNNLKVSSLLFGNQSSRIQFLQDTILYLHQNMDLGDGVLYFERGADIQKDPGKNLMGVVVVT